MSAHPELWKTLRWVVFSATLLLLAWLAIRGMERSVGSTVGGLEQVLGAITQSDTRIVEGRAEISESREISELALVEMKMSATRSFENEAYLLRYLPAGTKQLIVRGEYRVTAGYKLEPGVSLAMEGGVPLARFPEPRILAVELIDYQALSEKDGWANEVKPEDRAQLLRELRQQMRLEAQRSGVLEIVESTLRTRLRDLLGAGNVKVERIPE
ncbi:DUF4230 domain-containing protein [Luteolibacter marinus]|uniref:DUF4230 domain-containing protein n=1 Tax=Luteolibacter marinus TaxID=2776705 RepID=UPI0018680CE0|nr:DUF4230 domain-containing protein [Luteolibacter marinus]